MFFPLGYQQSGCEQSASGFKLSHSNLSEYQLARTNMEPQNLRFGGGATETLLHPLVAVEMVIAIILILCLPRKYAIAPLLFGVFTIPLGQVVVLAGIHFTVLRILILAGLVRRAASKQAMFRWRLQFDRPLW